LTFADRKLLKQITSFPWPEDLPPPLSVPLQSLDDEQLSDLVGCSYAALEVQLQAAAELQRRLADVRAVNAVFACPGMSDAQLRSMQFDTCLYLDNSGTVSIARRFLADDPEELIRFGVVATRMTWVLSGHGHQGCAGLWGAALGALAIGDELALQKFLATLPATIDETQTYPYPQEYAGLYNAVHGLLRGDWEAARLSVKTLPMQRLPKNEQAIVTYLRGILEGSSELVAEGLKLRAATVRKIRTLDPHFKLLDLTLHSLYQLCDRIDPALTKDWETSQGLPWDAELHERLQTGGDPLQLVDLSGLSERHRILLTEMPEPEWWCAVP
jgi:hypothetical protein